MINYFVNRRFFALSLMLGYFYGTANSFASESAVMSERVSSAVSGYIARDTVEMEIAKKEKELQELNRKQRSIKEPFLSLSDFVETYNKAVKTAGRKCTQSPFRKENDVYVFEAETEKAGKIRFLLNEQMAEVRLRGPRIYEYAEPDHEVILALQTNAPSHCEKDEDFEPDCYSVSAFVVFNSDTQELLRTIFMVEPYVYSNSVRKKIWSKQLPNPKAILTNEENCLE